MGRWDGRLFVGVGGTPLPPPPSGGSQAAGFGLQEGMIFHLRLGTPDAGLRTSLRPPDLGPWTCCAAVSRPRHPSDRRSPRGPFETAHCRDDESVYWPSESTRIDSSRTSGRSRWS